MKNTVLEFTTIEDKKTEILRMRYHESNERKVFVIVEGSDDKKIYSSFLDEEKVTFYVAENCLHVVNLLTALKTHPDLKDNLIGIKDADFDHILQNEYPNLDNLFLTDYHDIEMTMLSQDFEVRLKAEYSIPTHIPLIENVTEALEALSYLRLFNEVEIILNGMDGINFKDISYPELYDGENAMTWEHCISHIKSKSKNTTLEHFPTTKVLENFANKHPNIDLRQLTRGHDFMHALLVRLRKLTGHDQWGYKGLCLMLRSCSKDAFKQTSLFHDLNMWMEQKSLHLWNRTVA